MGNEQVMELCVTRNKDDFTKSEGGSTKYQTPKYKSIVREQHSGQARKPSSVGSFGNLPFVQTHINNYKKMVDQINAEKFTVQQMAKKFRAKDELWDDNSLWAEGSDLTILLRWFMPDSNSDGLVSYTSAMSLGLLLCNGSVYDKAKILFQLVESNSSQQTVFKNDEYLVELVGNMIAIASHKADEFFDSRPTRKMSRKMKNNNNGSSKMHEQVQATKDANVAVVDKVVNTNIQYAQELDNQVSNYFYDCTFGDSVCLSKMDFIIMLQSPNCAWIFEFEQIKDYIERYLSSSTKSSTKSSSPQTDQNSSTNYDEDVHSKMVEQQDELQYCQFEMDGDVEQRTDYS